MAGDSILHLAANFEIVRSVVPNVQNTVTNEATRAILDRQRVVRARAFWVARRINVHDCPRVVRRRVLRPWCNRGSQDQEHKEHAPKRSRRRHGGANYTR